MAKKTTVYNAFERSSYPEKDTETFTPYSRIPPIGSKLSYSSDGGLKQHKKSSSSEKAKSISAMEMRQLRRKTYVVLDPIVCKPEAAKSFENSIVFGQRMAHTDEPLHNLFQNLRLSHRKEIGLLNQWSDSGNI